jgi:hypothetical protein
VLGALRRAVKRKNTERRGHCIDDPDHRLLLDASLVRAHHGEEHRAAERESQRIPVGRIAVYFVPGE